jgi:poly-beta-1,6-N-acetyl-D-glucosamine synthase
MKPYVLITPARNEASNIERVIDSVLSQTVQPARWLIVNDGSTDNTEAIASKAARQHPFIELITIDGERSRAFSSKAHAFNFAVKHLAKTDYGFIGNLDADISIDKDYFKHLLDLLQSDCRLGLTGGIVYTTVPNGFATFDRTLDSVGGAVQFFRRECFEDIGGAYLPLPYGGIDAAAEIIAKMKGWKVRKVIELKAFEHRQTGTAVSSPMLAAFRLGRRFYSLGYSLPFYALRCVYRVADAPFLIGSVLSLFGFLEAYLKRTPVVLPPDVVSFLRREQSRKLLRTFMISRSLI